MTQAVDAARKAAQAHDYYMKHRKLKGRKKKAAPKVTEKVNNRKKKQKKAQKLPKAYTLATKTQSGGKAVKLSAEQHEAYSMRLKAKIADIREKANNLPPKEKQALKKALEGIKRQIKKG